MSNANLNKAKIEKNDEFYTQLFDVEKELENYKSFFKDKVVYCNCDNPIISAFWKYFHLHFSELGLKELVSTYYKQDIFNSKLFSLNKEPTYMSVYVGGNDVDIDMYSKTKLIGNGDFRSKECIEILKDSDFVVTNPPFSLFREYITQLIDYNKKFIIIGNKNSVNYKEVFPLIQQNRLHIGYNSPVEFDTPQGVTTKVQGLCRWFTNLDITKQYKKLELVRSITNTKYNVYDEIPSVIMVEKVADISFDYDGLMAVPITFLDTYNPDDYELIDLINRYTILDYFRINDDVRKRHSHCCNVNGVTTYPRIVIHKKIK